MSDELAASSAAPTTAATESTPAVTTPAPVSEAPAPETAPTAAPVTEPGPIPYSRFKEVNDQLRELRTFREKYGWAESVNGDEFQQIAKWANAYKTDPIRWYSETTAELRQLYPHLVPNLTSEAARILRNGGRSLEPEPEIEPAIPVMDGNGQVVDRAYSAAQVKELVQRAVQAAIGQEVAPIKQTFQQQQAQAKAQEERAKADQFARQLYERAQSWHGFKEHEADVTQAFNEHPDWSLHDAYLHVLHTKILPRADQKAQAKVLDHLQTQAAGATVHPGAAQSAAPPKFRNFKEAAEYYERNPKEAEAMAQR